jgi:hypothetical protein
MTALLFAPAGRRSRFRPRPAESVSSEFSVELSPARIASYPPLGGGCMWCDPRDEHTVTIAGGLISSWLDKPAGAAPMQQANPALQPTHVLGSHVSFGGAQWLSAAWPPTPLNPGAVACWFRRLGPIAGFEALLFSHTNAAQRVGLVLWPTPVDRITYILGTAATTGPVVADGAWHFGLLTWPIGTPGTAYGYCDGTVTPVPYTGDVGNSNFELGGNIAAGGLYLNGDLGHAAYLPNQAFPLTHCPLLEQCTRPG